MQWIKTSFFLDTLHASGSQKLLFFSILFYVLKGILKTLASFDDCALFTDLGFFS